MLGCVELTVVAGDFNDMFRFDPSTNSWEEVNYRGTPPSSRHGHGFVTAHDGALYIFGGMNSAGEDSFDILFVPLE